MKLAKLGLGVGVFGAMFASVMFLSVSGCGKQSESSPASKAPPVRSLLAAPRVKMMEESTGELTRRYSQGADGLEREVAIGFKDGCQGFRYLGGTTSGGQPRLTSAKEVHRDGSSLIFVFAEDGKTPVKCTAFRKDGTLATVTDFLEGNVVKVTTFQKDGKTEFSEETFHPERFVEKVFFQEDGVTLRAKFSARGDLTFEFASFGKDGVLEYQESSAPDGSGGLIQDVITVFGNKGRSNLYRQVWVMPPGEDKGQLQSLEEFFDDGVTVRRKFAFEIDHRSSKNKATGCEEELFSATGVKVAVKRLSGDLQVLQETTFKNGNEEAGTVKHAQGEGGTEKIEPSHLLEPASGNAQQLEELMFAWRAEQHNHLKQLLRQ